MHGTRVWGLIIVEYDTNHAEILELSMRKALHAHRLYCMRIPVLLALSAKEKKSCLRSSIQKDKLINHI